MGASLWPKHLDPIHFMIQARYDKKAGIVEWIQAKQPKINWQGLCNNFEAISFLEDAPLQEFKDLMAVLMGEKDPLKTTDDKVD
jgi:hypothetical protein